MKTTNKNNPAVVGALLGILLATLYFIMKQMGGGNTPVTLTPVAETHTDETPKTTAASASPSLQRDPFDHPALHRMAKDGTLGQSQAPEAQNASPTAPTGGKASAHPVNVPSVPVQPILPAPAKPKTDLPGGAMPGATVQSSSKPAGSGVDATLPEADDPLKGWHLTATVGGLHPRAVIEGAGIGIYRIGVGDHIQKLEVAAIHEREIVLSDAHHLYTLTLMSAPSALEDSKDSPDNKDASAETLTTTARENQNGTAKTHP